MTKEEFENSDKPLVIIASVALETGKCIADTYDYSNAAFWKAHVEKEFPYMFHFMTINAAAVKLRVHELTGKVQP